MNTSVFSVPYTVEPSAVKRLAELVQTAVHRQQALSIKPEPQALCDRSDLFSDTAEITCTFGIVQVYRNRKRTG